MNFDDAILNTALPNKLISGGFDDEQKTIGDFYKNFVEPRLPDPSVVYRWHEALVDYCTNPNYPHHPIFFLRGGAVAGNLRRGFLIKAINSDYYYAFSDNYLASYIYKMALDGAYPDDGDELYKLFTEFKDENQIGWLTISRLKQKNITDKYGNGKRMFPMMPVHYKKSAGKTYPDKYEEELNSFIINGPVCSIGEAGYKHSHVFDAGDKYVINGRKYKISDIFKKWFSLKECSKLKQDYVWNQTIRNYMAENDIVTTSDKNIAVACFLRFLDPINHFLAPKQGYNLFTPHVEAKINDIAEYPHLLEYIKNQYKQRYQKHYDDFTKLILPDNPIGLDYGSEIINIRYVGLDQVGVTKKRTKTAKSSKKHANNKTITARSGVGQYAKHVFETLLNQNKLTPNMINNLMDLNYCRKEIGVSSFPVLNTSRNPSTRYYSKSVRGYYISSQWFSKNKIKIDNWLANNNLSI